NALAPVFLFNSRNGGDAARGKIPEAFSGTKIVVGLAPVEARVILGVFHLHFRVGQGLEDAVVPFAQLFVGNDLDLPGTGVGRGGIPRTREVARIDDREI